MTTATGALRLGLRENLAQFSLLVGDAGRPDLHASGDATPVDMAKLLYRSIRDKLLTLPDHVLLYPSHFGGSVCGRGLSSNPGSTIGFERAHNTALRFGSESAFVEALVKDIPPAPEHQADRKSTRLNSSHVQPYRMPSSA